MVLPALPLADAPVQTIGFPVLVLLSWIPYHIRVRTLAAGGRAVPTWRQVCFAAGLVVLLIAASPPVDKLSEQLLVAHMAEHLLIGDIAGLLLVLGVTGPLLAPLLRNRVISKLRVLTHPVVALVVWTTNFYAWHTPLLYQAALRHDGLHALEHATFLAFGIAVWMALLGPLPKPDWFGNAARLVYIIVVRLIGTVLGNVLIFGGSVFYPFYLAGDAHWHITPIADQVAAGGLMMVEESLLTIGLFCWLFLRVARQQEERQTLLDYAIANGVELDERRAQRAVAAGRGDELLKRLRQTAGAPDAPPGTPDGAPATPDGAPATPDGAPVTPDGAPATPNGAPATSDPASGTANRTTASPA